MKQPQVMPEDKYQPTPAEMNMGNSISYLVDLMLHGQLKGVAIAAINNKDEHSCMYFNKSKDGVLGPPIEELRVMYETNQSFRQLDNTPLNNKSFRSH